MNPITLRTLIVCAVGAIAEAAVLVPVSGGNSSPLLVIFLIGPLAFLALLAWRRRNQLARPRRIFELALALALAGLGYYGFELSQSPASRSNPVLVPLVQWVIVLGFWTGVELIEARERSKKSSP